MKSIFTILFLMILQSQAAQAGIWVNEENANKRTSSHFIEQVLSNENTPTDVISQHTESINEVVLAFGKKKAKYHSDIDFLEHVFYKTHRLFLKNYKAYDSFQNLFEKGIYGCLTGTALYAVVLDKMDYSYDIIETNHHIYLLVESAEGLVLMESTDPLEGFSSNLAVIEKKINKELGIENLKENEFQYATNQVNIIGLKELVGLQYFNNSVNAYNAHDISTALFQLNEAAKYYPSPRITEFLEVINQTINNTVKDHLDSYQELSSLVVK